MDTENMEPFSSFYDLIDSPKPAAGYTKSGGDVNQEDDLPGLADLDPTVELSLDLQELIESATRSEADSHQLFPELTPCPEVVGRDQHQSSEVAAVNSSHNLQVQLMSQQIEVEVPASVSDIQPIFTVQASDLAALGLKLEPGTTDGVSFTIEPSTSEVIEVDSATSTTVSSTSQAEHHYSKPAGRRNSLKSLSSKSSSSSRRRQLEKGSSEYQEKRERNNVAVRKSRDKAKVQQKLTQHRVHDLVTENQNLQKKVDLLTKELSVLKGLFSNVGAAIPGGLGALFK